MGAPQLVPVAEKRRKVSGGPPVVGVMLWGAPPEAERHQVVHGPREVIAAVVLGGHVDVDDHEAPRGEAVTPQQNCYLF